MKLDLTYEQILYLSPLKAAGSLPGEEVQS